MAEQPRVPTPEPVRGLFLGFVAAVLIAGALAVGWTFVAPRDPGGRLCDAATPLRSLGALARGKVEARCPSHDKPIVERHLFNTRKERPERVQ